ncbi:MULTISPECIES: TauD/TfdA family dioxygenase [Ramlibacter]|uniref:TauD/TfdA family dioxygenase n=1 Tax=Ramlibacter pinisoli TaxID=2682844 RepID=A0A6N8J184_9BURK|nr:TauD/TfdA family dioxygenase [Ramlibacter sp. CGMCC 1.13660]MVQ31936.1 TauD/TfdA family dioxygenase [Ramlibacter pinisoli]
MSTEATIEQRSGAAAFEVVPSGRPAGAEIRGVDISRGVADGVMARIRDALHRWKVVVLRNQRITPEQQIAFSRYFGRLERHVIPEYLVPGYHDLVRVSNVLDDHGKPIGLVDAGRVWHTDGHFLPQPNLYSMLYAIEIPHDTNGAPLGPTLFANSAHAYEQLPASTKARLQGLRGANSLANVYARMHAENAAKNRPPLTEAQKREAVHPVVRTHPFTGEKCLYVSRAATGRIVDMEPQEGDALIGELSDWIVRDENVYTHRWQVGDLLLWDNCSSQHLAVGDYALPQRRLLHRTTVAGLDTF